MTLNPASVIAGYEPIPGYQLRHRLGAGGYGEVWMADAPGGLQKAVKLVFGTLEQAQASGELKSLRRISQVYHPFLLSIERIEIVDEQVVIVTELAECSLLDRFEQFRRKGAPGIHRGTLLEFLRDAADALDFLSQKHSLQHLDVKPGNLLLIADRIKVADFGLVKDLHSHTQSMISGLTPSYSAPEIFDGRPDHRSDQYSLAVLYMEMLTGKLPFDGKTTGEIARQHIAKAPNLEALPPADRAIVGRSLSKNPVDRYASCRQFIEQLAKVKNPIMVATHPVKSIAGQDSVAASNTEIQNTVTSPAFNARINFRSPIAHQTPDHQWNPARCLFIGMGGIAGDVLLNLRRRIAKDSENPFTVQDHCWRAIDTNVDALEKLVNVEEDCALTLEETCALPIFSPSEYRKIDSTLFSALSRRWLYNIPRSLKTEGVRPLAILAFLHHYAHLKKSLDAALDNLTQQQGTSERTSDPVRIYLIASLHGGTGSALMSEVGLLVNSLLQSKGIRDFHTYGFCTAAATLNGTGASLASAAGLASLAELQFMMSGEHMYPSIHPENALEGPVRVKPVTSLALLDGGLYGDNDDAIECVNALAQAVFLDSQSLCGATLDPVRRDDCQQPLGWLRTVRTGKLNIANSISPVKLARWCCSTSLANTLCFLTGTGLKSDRWSAVQTPPASAQQDPLCSAQDSLQSELPLSPARHQRFSTFLLRELGFCTSDDFNESPISQDSEEHSLELWRKRLEQRPDAAKLLIAEDLRIWQAAVSKQIGLRLFNWKQIEQLQLHAIEQILDFSEIHLSALMQHIQPKLKLQNPPDDLQAAASQYCQTLTVAYMERLKRYQAHGKQIAQKLEKWCDSIVAETVLNESEQEVSFNTLPIPLQRVAERVNNALNAKLQKLITPIIESIAEPTELGVGNAHMHEGTVAEINLKYMLNLASDLLNRYSREGDISDAVFQNQDIEEEFTTQLKEISSFVSNLSMVGGDADRIVIGPADQLELIQPFLQRNSLHKSTTLLPTSCRLGLHLFSEATHVNLPALIATLWRPSSDTLRLAERLHTRVDVEWAPVSGLLELLAVPEETSTDPSAMDTSDLTEGTIPCPSALPLPTGSMTGTVDGTLPVQAP
ncbi:protein kinase domain-containing protein [Aureliella helgolandensis]|uniref:Tubulin-like protein n=1 Tax=Aureliella helgolandensis TaxID=2527968 RepID=A0A518G567_9BACT|nr:protein kinase [Aureliella helgolandensis]QDV23689.1 Tubulin-like protein [Aureliella helgolandensis]